MPKSIKNQLLLLVLLLVVPWALLAQRLPKPEALTMHDGLGFRDVKAIAQDTRGLMWFGTSKGIERYDGLRFVRYGNDWQANFPLPGNEVSNEHMLMVNDSCLWALIDGVLVSLNLRTNKTTDLGKAAALSGYVHTLRQSADGTIWIVTDDDREQQLLRHEGSNRFKLVATAQHLRMPFNDVEIDTAGNVWWSTNAEGLRQFSPEGKLLHALKPDSINWNGTKIYFTNISTDSQNRLFVFPKSTNEIWQYHPETRKLEVLAAQLSSRVFLTLEDTRGNLWFSTFDGLLRWSESGEWTDFTALLHKSLQFTNIRHLYEDRTHLLWIATDNGLLRFPISRDMFQNYLTVADADWGNAMRGIFADNEGRVYAFCENGQQGLHQIDLEKHKTKLVYPFHDSLSEEPVMEQIDHLAFDKQKNTVWALNDNLLKINTLDLHGSIVENLTDVSNRVSKNPFCFLGDGKMVLGSTLDKLTIYDPVGRERSSFFPNRVSSIPSANVEVVGEGPNGQVWVGTNSEGLFCFSQKGEMLAQFSTKSKVALSKNHVLSLLFDKTGRLWIGTFGSGLNCLSGNFSTMENLSVQVYTQKEGLSDNNVVSLLEDEEGNIWAATYHGLSCYRVSEGVFRNFYEEDGLSNNEFNYASFFKDEQGGMWFGGMNGVNYFNPKDILQTEKNPPLCLTAFTKYNSRTDSTEWQMIGDAQPERFVISPYDSWFQFGWALPNYFKPDKNHYYVQLEGLEDDWSYLGSTPFVRYNKLPAGDYTLRVKASDSKGNWSVSELAIPITIQPFFYQRWWFYLLVLVLVGGIGYRISRYRHYRLLEMERMRTRIASDLHDEVGSMLSGLSMQAELLEMTAPAKDRDRIEHIGDISRTAVSKMRDLVWSIDSRRDKVKNLLERMQEQATDLLQPHDISCQFELGDLPLEKKLPVDLRQHLFLIFKEALNNISRHSNATNVTVRFGNFNGRFEMSIHDNGTSLQKDSISTGLGLSNMEMRARKLGAKWEVRHHKGFCVRLSMKAL